MKVRNKLAIQFTLLFAGVLLLVLTGVYTFVAHNRTKTFFSKLDDRAITVAQFYLAEDNLSKEKFRSVLQKFPQALSGESIRIYDEHFRPQFVPEGSVRWPNEVLSRVAAQKSLHLTDGRKQATGIYYQDNSGNFIIMVSASDNIGYQDMRQLAFIMLFFFLLSLLVTFLLGNVFSRLALIPIVSITSNLKRIRSTSLDLRLPVSARNADEIDQLSQTINQLLEHLEQSFENQQAFIANASHELRTPITTILGESEIALIRDRSTEDYKATLDVIIKEAERLGYIINSLMDLVQTNIESKQFASIKADVLLEDLRQELLEEDVNHRLKVDCQLKTGPAVPYVWGNRQLLFIAVGNIVRNALKFSKNVVFCELTAETQAVYVAVTDSGIGISKDELSKIFQPFYRTRTAIGYPGSGIGLSLSQSIVRLHNGQIQVSSEPGAGTRFEIRIPAYR